MVYAATASPKPCLPVAYTPEYTFSFPVIVLILSFKIIQNVSPTVLQEGRIGPNTQHVRSDSMVRQEIDQSLAACFPRLLTGRGGTRAHGCPNRCQSPQRRAMLTLLACRADGDGQRQRGFFLTRQYCLRNQCRVAVAESVQLVAEGEDRLGRLM